MERGWIEDSAGAGWGLTPSVLVVPGYYGDNCTNVCELNPCEHQSVCTRKPSAPHGYTCECPPNYLGPYCETR